MAVTYSPRPGYAGVTGTVAYGANSLTFNIGAALTAGGGSIVVNDADIAQALDRYPPLYRSSDDGQPLATSIQQRWQSVSVGSALAASDVAFEVRRTGEQFARWQVLGDGSEKVGSGAVTPVAVSSPAVIESRVDAAESLVSGVAALPINLGDSFYAVGSAKSASYNGGAIAAAIAALPAVGSGVNQSGGRGLYLPGTQEPIPVDRTLELPTGACFFGDGHGASKLSGSVWPTVKAVGRNVSVQDMLIDNGVVLEQPNDGDGGEANNYLRRARVRVSNGNPGVRLGRTDGTFGMGCHIGEDVTIQQTSSTNGVNAVEVYGPDNVLLNPRVTSYYGPAVLLDSKSASGGWAQVIGGHFFGLAQASGSACAFRVRGGIGIQLRGFYCDNYRQGASIIVDPPTGQAVQDLTISGHVLNASTFRNSANGADVDGSYPVVKLDTSGGGSIEAVTVKGLHGHAVAGGASRWSYIVDASAGVTWFMEDCHMRDVLSGLYNPAGPPAVLR